MDYAEYKSKIMAPHQRRQFFKQNSATATTWRSSWAQAPNAGAAPTTAAVPTSATVGALGQLNPSSDLYLANVDQGSTPDFCMIICDRLSHQGGLDGTVATAQTTNLPTAALTRYTSGIGVMIGIEIYTDVGGTGRNLTCSYTNTTPTSGRTSRITQFGGTGFLEAGKMVLVPFSDSSSADIGVTSVESVTLSASTGTAGNFGVTLFKPLFPVFHSGFPIQGNYDSILRNGGILPEIIDNACLFAIYTTGSSQNVIRSMLRFIES